MRRVHRYCALIKCSNNFKHKLKHITIMFTCSRLDSEYKPCQSVCELLNPFLKSGHVLAGYLREPKQPEQYQWMLKSVLGYIENTDHSAYWRTVVCVLDVCLWNIMCLCFICLSNSKAEKTEVYIS